MLNVLQDQVTTIGRLVAVAQFETLSQQIFYISYTCTLPLRDNFGFDPSLVATLKFWVYCAKLFMRFVAEFVDICDICIELRFLNYIKKVDPGEYRTHDLMLNVHML